MVVIKDLVNMIKNSVDEIHFQKEGEIVRIREVNMEQTQLIDLEYSQDWLFPIEFSEIIKIYTEHLDFVNTVFSKFKEDFIGFIERKDDETYLKFREIHEKNPEIEIHIPLLKIEDYSKPRYPEIYHTASFRLFDKFDCKKINAFVVEDDVVYVGELKENKETYEYEISNQIAIGQVDWVKHGTPYFVFPRCNIPFGKDYCSPPSKECKTINAFVSAFGSVEAKIGENIPLELKGEKKYIITRDYNEYELTVRGRLLTAPQVPKYLKL